MATVAEPLSETTQKSTPIVEYNVSDEAIRQLGERLECLTADTPSGYKQVVAGIGEVRKLRGAVEKTRKLLKADALAYGRKVDGEAKRITAKLGEVEEPLKIAKQEVDDEKARIKREAEEAEQRRTEAVKRKAREEQDAIDKAERDRIKAEQVAEQQRLDAERAELQNQQAAEFERRKVEQDRLNAEKDALKKEREAFNRERFEREAKAKAEREAKKRAETEAKNKADDLRMREENQRRLESLKPDVVKAREFSEELLAMGWPDDMTTVAGKVVIEIAMKTIEGAADELEKWCNECEALRKLISIG